MEKWCVYRRENIERGFSGLKFIFLIFLVYVIRFYKLLGWNFKKFSLVFLVVFNFKEIINFFKFFKGIRGF